MSQAPLLKSETIKKVNSQRQPFTVAPLTKKAAANGSVENRKSTLQITKTLKSKETAGQQGTINGLNKEVPKKEKH